MKRVALVLAAAAAAGCVYAVTPASAEPAVDSDRYRADGGGYAFTYRYDGANRVCSIAPDPTTVRCAIVPQAGTRITVGGRSVRPTGIEFTDRGWRYTVRSGREEQHRALPAGARISVDGASCSAQREGGIECRIDGVGFRLADGTFSTRGHRLG